MSRRIEVELHTVLMDAMHAKFMEGLLMGQSNVPVANEWQSRADSLRADLFDLLAEASRGETP